MFFYFIFPFKRHGSGGVGEGQSQLTEISFIKITDPIWRVEFFAPKLKFNTKENASTVSTPPDAPGHRVESTTVLEMPKLTPICVKEMSFSQCSTFFLRCSPYNKVFSFIVRNIVPDCFKT